MYSYEMVSLLRSSTCTVLLVVIKGLVSFLYVSFLGLNFVCDIKLDFLEITLC